MTAELDRMLSGEKIDAAPNILKREGLGYVEAIKAVMRVYGVSLATAKKLVHLSAAYSEIAKEAEVLQEAVIEEFEEDDSGVKR